MHLGTHLDHCYYLSLVSPQEDFFFWIATNSLSLGSLVGTAWIEEPLQQPDFRDLTRG